MQFVKSVLRRYATKIFTLIFIAITMAGCTGEFKSLQNEASGTSEPPPSVAPLDTKTPPNNPESTAPGNNDSVSITEFGADPTGVRDSSDAFYKALENVHRIPVFAEGEIVIPCGTFRLAKTVTISDPISIRGIGTCSVVRTDEGITAFVFNGPFGSNRISNFSLFFNGAPNNANTGIYLNGATYGYTNFVISNVALIGSGLGRGLAGDFALKGVVRDSVIEGWAYGIQFRTLNGQSSNANLVSGCKLRSNYIGFYFDGDTGTLEGNTIEANLIGAYIHTHYGVYTLIGNHFEQAPLGADRDPNALGPNPDPGKVTNLIVHGWQVTSVGNTYASGSPDILLANGPVIFNSFGDVIYAIQCNPGTTFIREGRSGTAESGCAL